MALTSGSKILVSDISTALGGKIDTAGTGLSKSGTTLALATVTTSGGTAGPTANATPSYGATFTVPKVVYDKYGRVTGHTNYTVKIPAAPSGGTANATVTTPNVFVTSFARNVGCTLPNGGQWAWIVSDPVTANDTNGNPFVGVTAGGTSGIGKYSNTAAGINLIMAIRTA